MDKITHEIRLNNWKKIVEECNNRPNGTTVKEWLATNGIKEKTYYYWLRRVRRAAYEQIRYQASGELTVPHENQVSYAEITINNTVPAQPAHSAATITIGNTSLGISDQVSEEFLIKLIRAMKYAG